MEDRFHFTVGTVIFETEILQFFLGLFDIETEMFSLVGIGTDRNDLAAKVMVDL